MQYRSCLVSSLSSEFHDVSKVEDCDKSHHHCKNCLRLTYAISLNVSHRSWVFNDHFPIQKNRRSDGLKMKPFHGGKVVNYESVNGYYYYYVTCRFTYFKITNRSHFWCVFDCLYAQGLTWKCVFSSACQTSIFRFNWMLRATSLESKIVLKSFYSLTLALFVSKE